MPAVTISSDFGAPQNKVWIGSPNPESNTEFLGCYHLGGGGSQNPFEWDLPAPLTPCPFLFSSMVCLYLFRGSWMAALTEQLVLSPPLAWARETQCKHIPWIVSYCGVGEERNLVLSLCPGHVP